jgi:hypothetical protein
MKLFFAFIPLSRFRKAAATPIQLLEKGVRVPVFKPYHLLHVVLPAEFAAMCKLLF